VGDFSQCGFCSFTCCALLGSMLDEDRNIVSKWGCLAVCSWCGAPRLGQPRLGVWAHARQPCSSRCREPGVTTQPPLFVRLTTLSHSKRVQAATYAPSVAPSMMTSQAPSASSPIETLC